MSEKIKFYLQGFAFFLVMMVPAIMAPTETYAASKVQIPTSGKDANGKYPVYQITGELDDINYFSKDGSTLYNPGDLIGRMRFIDQTDFNKNGYQCEYICKDKTGNVVGISPDLKWMLKKK